LSPPARIQKIQVPRAGSFGQLKVVEADSPAVSPAHALVRSASIGVNFADCVVRMGLYPSATKYVGWPITPGFEFSGVIETLGEGDNPRGLQVGDEVFGVVRFGAYSSVIEVPLSQLYRVPERLSLVQAGAISVASLTAWYALGELGQARPKMNILVHSAAGGVGSMMVQIGKLLGCRVVGVVSSSAKVSAVRELGADVVIDKSSESLFGRAQEECPDGYDLVLDANGAETLRGSYRALRSTGRLILYGAHSMLARGSGRTNWLRLAWQFLRTPSFDPLTLIDDNKSVMAFNLSYLFDEQELLESAFTRISTWYAEGALHPPQIKEYALADVALAHEALQSGTTIGKLTLIP